MTIALWILGYWAFKTAARAIACELAWHNPRALQEILKNATIEGLDSSIVHGRYRFPS